MEKRLIIFFVLTFLIFSLHSKLFGPPPKKETAPIKGTVSETAKGTVSKTAQIKEKTLPSFAEEEEELLIQSQMRELRNESEIFYLENPFMKIGFSTLGASIQECILRGTDIIRNGDYTLVQTQDERFKPGGIPRFGDYGDFTKRLFTLEEQTYNSLTFKIEIENKLFLFKQYYFDPIQYILHLDIRIKNVSDHSIDVFKGYDLTVQSLKSEGKKDARSLLQMNYVIGEGIGEYKKKKVGKIKERSVQLGNVHWAGARSKYFITILDPHDETQGIVFDQVAKDGIHYVSALRMNDFSIGSGEVLTQKSAFYLGPNDWDYLQAYGKGYESILGFNGFLGPVTKILLRLMRWFNGWVNNYGLAIILLTIVIKILFFPLSNISMKSMKKMKDIQPQLTELKTKLKDNPKKMQQETMALYKANGVNPLSGCLPMLIQIPIFIAFYQLLMGCIELRGASFLWINNLSEPDTLFSIGPLPINILPLIMGGTMFWQQKMTPAPDPSQAKMMMFMPVFFTFLFYGMGSGLVLYWLINNVLTIAQQYWTQGSSK